MLSANVSAFSMRKAVGGGGGPTTLAWANDDSRPYIAYESGSFTIFLVPIADSSEDPDQWLYSNNGGASWTSFSGAGSAIVTVSTPFVFDGVTYNYYAKSPNWTTGNPSYIQRFGNGTVFGFKNSLGEVIARGNNAGNYPE